MNVTMESVERWFSNNLGGGPKSPPLNPTTDREARIVEMVFEGHLPNGPIGTHERELLVEWAIQYGRSHPKKGEA